MKRLYTYLLSVIFIVLFLNVEGQVSIKDSSLTIPMFYGAYSYQVPLGDMADRFGGNSAIGPGFQIKTKSNWIFGAEWDFMFGNNVKDGFSIFEEIMTDDGNIINGDGLPAVVALSERGNIFTLRFGKLFPVFSRNPNSGIHIGIGIGFMNHKIHIEVENNNAPQLVGDYKRGYDRLSSGFVISEYVGYLYMGNARVANFFAGVEFYQAFTKSRRDYIFDLMSPDNEKRLDMLIGPKVAWIIPLHRRAPQEYYLY